MIKTKIKTRRKILIGIALIFTMLFFIAAFLSAGCSNKTDIKSFVKNKLTSEDEMDMAVSIAEDFFNCMKSGDYEKAYELLSVKDKEKHDFEAFKEELKNVTKIIKFEINWVEIKNNIANVGIDLTDLYDNEEKVYKDLIVSLLKEEDGSWGINFWN